MTGPIPSVAGGVRLDTARFSRAASDVVEASGAIAGDADSGAQPELVDVMARLATAKAAAVASLNAARVVNEALMEIVRGVTPDAIG
jgi:hypothetical protein